MRFRSDTTLVCAYAGTYKKKQEKEKAMSTKEPTEQQRARIKMHLLDIMDEIHRICVKHNIKYSLMYGSMMGAVLYSGFIPWDDDIDIVFLRPEYDKFVDVCSSELSDEFFFQTMETDPEYLEPELFRVRKNGTVLLEGADAHRNIHHGVWVDITLMENCDGNVRKVRNCKHYFSLWRDKYYYHGAVGSLNIKGLLYQTARRILPPFTIKATARAFSRRCVYCQDNASPYVFHPFSYQEDIYPREWLDSYVLTPFEGRKYMMFQRADEILRVRFPQYTPDYPEERRHTTHGFIEIKV